MSFVLFWLLRPRRMMPFELMGVLAVGSRAEASRCGFSMSGSGGKNRGKVGPRDDERECRPEPGHREAGS